MLETSLRFILLFSNAEQVLLESWRSLSPDQQQEVIDFVEFLTFKQTSSTGNATQVASSNPFGERLRQLRKEIVASGIPLLDWQGVEREKAERRGG